jgi:hypothetical protein
VTREPDERANTEDDADGHPGNTVVCCPRGGRELSGPQTERCPTCGAEAVPVRTPQFAPVRGRGKRVCLLIILAVPALAGVVDALIYPKEMPGLLLAVPFAIATLSWCIQDANERADRIGYPLRALILFLAPLGVSIYFLSRRRIGSFLKAAAFAVVAIVVSALAYSIAYRWYWHEWPGA